MPNIRKETVRKMKQVIAAVLAEPEFYDQNAFPCNEDCGTTCCAAGWAVWLNVPEEEYASMVQTTLATPWRAKAEECLGLPYTDSSLFGLHIFWPDTFMEMYRIAKTPKQRAQAMAARWRHYIETDGKD